MVPLLLARVYYDDLSKSVNVYSWVALAPETSAVLSAVGVINTIHSVPGDSAPGLTFTPMHVGAVAMRHEGRPAVILRETIPLIGVTSSAASIR